MRRNGVARSAGCDRGAWREKFGQIVENLLHAPPRPYRPALDLELDTDPRRREWRAAVALARRRRLGPYRPDNERKDKRARDLAAMARAGFDYDVARKVIDAASVDALDEE